jgi:hypothetical protein
MTVFRIALGIAAAFLAFTVPSRKVLDAPIFLCVWLGGAFLAALAGAQSERTGELAIALNVIGTGIALGTLARLVLDQPNIWAMHGMATLTWGACGLVLLSAAHNARSLGVVFDERFSDAYAMNPWGLPLTIILMLLCIASVDTWRYTATSKLRLVVASASVLLFVFQALVYRGVIDGNSTKLADEIGGVGLAGMSTNETGTLGVALILWGLHLGRKSERGSLWLWCSVFAALAATALTMSRTAMSLAVICVAANLFNSLRAGWARKLVLAPMVLLCVFTAYQVISARTAAERLNPSAVDPLTRLPGSNRAVIWSEYWDAFWSSGRLHPSELIVGTGPVGLLQLYDATDLKSRGLVMTSASFFHTHSDLLTITLTCGLTGVFFWLMVIAGLLRLPVARSNRTSAYCAVLVFVAVGSVDMIIHIPVATVLLMALIARTLDVEPQTGRSRIPSRQIGWRDLISDASVR